ncbi:MAG: flavodoxin family protein, partial [Thermoplasmata archaeon]
MVRVLVCYYSRTGNTKKMAELIVEGARSEGIDVDLKKAEETVPKDLLNYDGIILGSPTY